MFKLEVCCCLHLCQLDVGLTGGVSVVFFSSPDCFCCLLFCFVCLFFPFEKKKNATCWMLLISVLFALMPFWLAGQMQQHPARLLLPASNAITGSTVMNFIDLPHRRNVRVQVSQMLRLVA